MTPAASRPMGRTSRSWKRAMRPCAVARMMSSDPDETATQARASSSPTVRARMPVERTRSKRSMGVFLTMPCTVAMTRLWPGSKSGSVMTARTRSPASTWTPSRLMMGMPLACREASGHGVHLGAEDAAAVGEEERPVVRVGHEEVRHGVLLDGAGADDALAAARLAPVGDERLALDVAAPRDGDDDVLVGDEVLVGELLVGAALDARAAVLAVPDVQLAQLVADDLEHALGVGEDVLQLGDALDDGHVLVLDLLALQRGQAAQLHLEDGVGLDLGEAEAAHQVGAGGVHVGRLADGADDRVEVVERGLEALEDVGPVARLAAGRTRCAAARHRGATRCGAAGGP